MDEKTMKLMTMIGAIYPLSDADRIYLPRKSNLAFVFKIMTEKILIAVRRSNMVKSEEATDKIAYKMDEFLYSSTEKYVWPVCTRNSRKY